MFCTFSTSSINRQDDGEPKPKRRQVLRACEACRIKRSKCDNSTPCAACEKNSLALADCRCAKISSLKERIRILEESQSQGVEVTPPSSGSDSPPGQDTLVEWKDVIQHRQFAWPNDPVHYVRNGECAYFGTLSAERFITRIKDYWNCHLEKSICRDFFHLKSLPTSCRQPRDLSELSTLDGGGGIIFESEMIPRNQQWQYIRQFWHLHHPSLPIICEKDFTAHFESLWIAGSAHSVQRTRAPSALADIVIATCASAKSSSFKHISGQIPLSHSSSGDSLRELTDSAISVWHYRRCQRLLDDELDMPTTFTVQAQILMAVYLNSTSRMSAAYNALGTAVRIAYSLGLHRDPPESLAITKAELCRRIWWSLYILDSKLSMELGLPMIVDLNISNCRLPVDDLETARIASLQPYTSTPGMTWLTYIVQAAKLCTIVRSISMDLYDESSNTNGTLSKLTTNETQTSHNLMHTAERLEKKLGLLNTWVDGLPSDLRLPRTGKEESLSTEVSSLYLDLYAPRWMQNQQIFLEIDYHNAIMILIRPIVPVGTAPEQMNGTMIKLMKKLIEHSIAIIQICHQCSLETDVFADHPELSAIVWNAAVTLLYRLTSITDESDESKRLSKSLSLVLEVLENVDCIKPAALDAMASVRHLQQPISQWTPTPIPSQLNIQVEQPALLLDAGMDVESLIMPPSSTVADGGHLNSELGALNTIQDWDPDLWLSVPRPN